MAATAECVMRGKATPPPWIRDGEPDRWIKVGQFARLMNRSPFTIYYWLNNNILSDFGYRAYCDARGRWFIQVSRSDLDALKRMRPAS